MRTAEGTAPGVAGLISAARRNFADDTVWPEADAERAGTADLCDVFGTWGSTSAIVPCMCGGPRLGTACVSRTRRDV